MTEWLTATEHAGRFAENGYLSSPGRDRTGPQRYWGSARAVNEDVDPTTLDLLTLVSCILYD